jgi:hypothetical protein
MFKLIIIGCVAFLFIVYALCKIAGKSDNAMERILNEK